jgi:hypothetical protein
MSRLRTLLMALALLCIVSGGQVLFSNTAHAQSAVPSSIVMLGGVDLNGYCRSIGNVSASLDGPTAYDWRCVTPSGNHVGIYPNITAACHWQYSDSKAVDTMGNFYDPESWRCFTNAIQYSEGVGSNGAYVNLDGYCKSLGDTGVSLDGKTAYDWHCVATNGEHIPYLSISKACQWTFGQTGFISRLRDFYDPNSWQCWGPLS